MKKMIPIASQVMIDLDPDKPACATCCLEDVTSPSFLCVFVPNSMTFATDPRCVESVTGSVPVEHPHKVCALASMHNRYKSPDGHYNE